MDWLFDNLGKLIPFIIAIIYVLGSLKGKKVEDEEYDPEEEARARRIQEEIRRKILERQQGTQPAPPPIPVEEPNLREIVFEEELHHEEPRSTREAVPSHNDERNSEPESVAMDGGWWSPGEDQSKLLEEQERLIQSRMAEAKRLRELAAKSEEADSRILSETPSISVSQLRRGLLGDLADNDSIRKALVLKEVLDTPVGLR